MPGARGRSPGHPPPIATTQGVLEMPALTPDEVARRMPTVPGWRLEGDALRRTFAFADFRAAIDFVNEVADRAEAADHHPDIDIRYDHVTLTLTTHDEGGLTAQDFEMARRIGGG
jgi:4a-hydroxytetrahydrobiopterin dehydratase